MLTKNYIQQTRKPSIWSGIFGLAALLLIGGFFIYYRQYKINQELNGPVTSLAQVLGTKNPEAEQGKNAVFADVVVKLANNDDIVFWIAENSLNNNERRGLLVFTSFRLQNEVHRANNSRLKDGQHIKITGVLKLPPSVAEMKNMWQLSDLYASWVKGQQIYLDADSLQILQ